MKRIVPLLALVLLLAGCSAVCPSAPTQSGGAADRPAPQVSPRPTAEATPAATPGETPAPPGTPSPAVPPRTEPPVSTETPEPTPEPLPEPEIPADEAVLAAYARAEEAYGWFVMGPPELDRGDQRTVGELTYCRVADPRFSTLVELRGYLKGLFSDELVEQLLPADGGQFIEVDGTLYTIDGGRGSDVTKGEETVQVLRDGTPGRCTVRVTVEVLDPGQDYAAVGEEQHDFLYEQVGEQWIFTTFSAVR